MEIGPNSSDPAGSKGQDRVNQKWLANHLTIARVGILLAKRPQSTGSW